MFVRKFSGLLLSVLLLFSLVTSSADAAQGYQRDIVSYTIPNVTLINQNREKIQINEILASGKPVFLDFIYATCTTICPVLSAGFSNMQKRLAKAGIPAHFISVTIDPEHDNPEILMGYKERYRGLPTGWDFLTGNRKDINEIMYAFDAFVSNKMSHYPIMFLKRPDDDSWVRIYGLIGTNDLMAEFEKVYPQE